MQKINYSLSTICAIAPLPDGVAKAQMVDKE